MCSSTLLSSFVVSLSFFHRCCRYCWNNIRFSFAEFFSCWWINFSRHVRRFQRINNRLFTFFTFQTCSRKSLVPWDKWDSSEISISQTKIKLAFILWISIEYNGFFLKAHVLNRGNTKIFRRILHRSATLQYRELPEGSFDGPRYQL